MAENEVQVVLKDWQRLLIRAALEHWRRTYDLDPEEVAEFEETMAAMRSDSKGLTGTPMGGKR